ncbi:MAG: D-alanine--D-alanine ligase [Bacteroidaceae bacterium]|nr:D-alanine--D-alanine ligase [Bacteroidaceae bacterium]
MKKTIAIICGGDTSEHDVSMRSAAGIESFLDKDRYIIYKVEMCHGKWEAILADGSRTPVDRNDFSFLVREERIRPDFCYITIHGAPGENGILQGYFDLIKMPYSTCNVLVEAMTYDKFVLNNYMRSLGVSVADSLLIRQGHDTEVTDEDIISRIGLPCFVKPASGGSSFGTTKVKEAAQLRPAINLALQEGEDIMVEAFLQGTEITCGCYKTRQGAHVLPITEVVTENEFFDYDAKYNGQVTEITPARISDRLTERVQTLTGTLYDILGCHGIIRIDYIITEGDHIHLLEINTTPGMTATSFIPQQVRAAGLDIKDVMTEIIEDTLASVSS